MQYYKVGIVGSLEAFFLKIYRPGKSESTVFSEKQLWDCPTAILFSKQVVWDCPGAWFFTEK